MVECVWVCIYCWFVILVCVLVPWLIVDCWFVGLISSLFLAGYSLWAGCCKGLICRVVIVFFVGFINGEISACIFRALCLVLVVVSVCVCVLIFV